MKFGEIGHFFLEKHTNSPLFAHFSGRFWPVFSLPFFVLLTGCPGMFF
jgi:hypothetical protein